MIWQVKKKSQLRVFLFLINSWLVLSLSLHQSILLHFPIIHTLPFSVFANSEKVIHIHKTPFIKWVKVITQMLEIGNALFGHKLPGGQSAEHEECVESQQTNHSEASEWQNDHVYKEHHICLPPVLPLLFILEVCPIMIRKVSIFKWSISSMMYSISLTVKLSLDHHKIEH